MLSPYIANVFFFFFLPPFLWVWCSITKGWNFTDYSHVYTHLHVNLHTRAYILSSAMWLFKCLVGFSFLETIFPFLLKFVFKTLTFLSTLYRYSAHFYLFLPIFIQCWLTLWSSLSISYLQCLEPLLIFT